MMRPTRSLEGIDTAQVPLMPRTDKISRVSPMRSVAMQAALRREAVIENRHILRPLLQCLFMKVVAYYHEHLSQPMPCEMRDALGRVHNASQGLFPEPSVLFLDLRTIQDSEAGKAHSKLIEEALEALFAR